MSKAASQSYWAFDPETISEFKKIYSKEGFKLKNVNVYSKSKEDIDEEEPKPYIKFNYDKPPENEVIKLYTKDNQEYLGMCINGKILQRIIKGNLIQFIESDKTFDGWNFLENT